MTKQLRPGSYRNPQTILHYILMCCMLPALTFLHLHR
jgi:hypothetical protein